MINFVISQLDSIPTLNGMEKVISTIHWRAQKTHQVDGADVFTADTYGALSVGAPHEASFTPYEEVTKEMVEGWLTADLDCEAIEANLDAQIQNFLTPPIVAYALPWIPTVSAPVVVAEETTEEETTTEEPTAEEEIITE
jgi:hypothetical protein